MMRIVIYSTLLTVLGFTAACGGDDNTLPPGNVSVDWLVGTGNCELAGVETVAVFVSTDGQMATDLFTFDCNQRNAMLTGLQPGVYSLSLRGRDVTGRDRFGGEVPNVQVRSSGTTTVPTVRLTALPASISVTWYFENGRMCAFNDVVGVQIALFEDQYQIYEAEADCTLGEAVLEDIQADTYIVDIIGLDANGRALFNGQDEVEVGRGDIATADVRLMPITGPEARQ